MFNLKNEIIKLKNKEKLDDKDIVNLIFYCEILLKRNEVIGVQLQESIDTIMSLRSRIKFYRNANLPKFIH